MKKTMIVLVSVALVLTVLVGGLLAWLFIKLNPKQEAAPSVEAYLTENWKVFRLRSYDPDTGSLALDYPLQFTYAQMKKYGGSMQELQDLPIGNLDTVESLKTAVRETTKVILRNVTVYGMTSDEQVAYTVLPDGTITACWDE